MPRTVETTVYQYDELPTEQAKERAREWYRKGIDYPDYADHTIEDFGRVCELLGVELDTRTVKLYGGGTRQEPEVSWSGFWSQGDGASFTGRYRYNLQCVRKVRAYAPKDDELHRIARELTEVQRKYGYRLQAEIRRTSHHYAHEHTVTPEVEYVIPDNHVQPHTREPREVSEADQDRVIEALRDLMRWLYRQLEQEYEYQTSDEQVAENIRANEYEFTEDGERA